MLTVNSAEFAQARESISGSLTLDQLPRVAAQVLSASGLQWRLTGDVDALQRPVLHLQVEGELNVQCQRCLGPMSLPLECDTWLTQFADEAVLDEAEQLDDDLEGMVINPALDVLELVEEEVLLALPFAPRHDDCAGKAVVVQDEKPNPFAVLAQLKTRKAE